MNIKATVVSARDVGFGMFLSRVALSVTASKLSVVLVWFFFNIEKEFCCKQSPLGSVYTVQWVSKSNVYRISNRRHVSTRLVLNAGLGLDHVVS